MKATIEVVPYRYLYNPATGARASARGAKPPGYEIRTAGFTWRKIDARGSVTYGLPRRTAATRAEADAVAAQVAANLGWRVIE